MEKKGEYFSAGLILSHWYCYLSQQLSLSPIVCQLTWMKWSKGFFFLGGPHAAKLWRQLWYSHHGRTQTEAKKWLTECTTKTITTNFLLLILQDHYSSYLSKFSSNQSDFIVTPCMTKTPFVKPFIKCFFHTLSLDIRTSFPDLHGRKWI